MTRLFRIFLLGSLVLVVLCQNVNGADGTIRIGFNIPLVGMFSMVGNHAKDAAELVRKDLIAQGGLRVGDKIYDVEFLYGNNNSNPVKASALTVEHITKDSVLAMIGPLSSRQAIPVAEMADSFSTTVISPWSTSPVTTKDKPFSFRSCFIYTEQGPVLTQYTAKEYGATRAAVLYDILSAYPRGMASSFKAAFEKVNGTGSVVAFEEFRTEDKDFRPQLERIRLSGAQVLFTPQHYNEVPLIVRQAKEVGLDIPIVGSNSWAGGDLVGECGSECNGLIFTGNYAPGGATGINKTFVESYSKAYGKNPDEPAALTWDAIRALLKAIQNTGELTGNLLQDRKAVNTSLAQLKNFDGASGMMSFNASGTPEKCTIIVKIVDGLLTFNDSVCP